MIVRLSSFGWWCEEGGEMAYIPEGIIYVADAACKAAVDCGEAARDVLVMLEESCCRKKAELHFMLSFARPAESCGQAGRVLPLSERSGLPADDQPLTAMPPPRTTASPVRSALWQSLLPSLHRYVVT